MLASDGGVTSGAASPAYGAGGTKPPLDGAAVGVGASGPRRRPAWYAMTTSTTSTMAPAVLIARGGRSVFACEDGILGAGFEDLPPSPRARTISVGRSLGSVSWRRLHAPGPRGPRRGEREEPADPLSGVGDSVSFIQAGIDSAAEFLARAAPDGDPSLGAPPGRCLPDTLFRRFVDGPGDDTHDPASIWRLLHDDGLVSGQPTGYSGERRR